MLPNPFQAILKTCDSFSQCIQSHISHFIDNYTHQSDKQPHPPLFRKNLPLFSLFSKPAPLQSKQEDEKEEGNSSYPISSIKGQPARPLSKEELGRATWTLLHTLAAQFPEHPTKQQKRDVKELMAILSRLYPCKECADHFKEVLKANPVQAESQAEFSQWLCHAHNVVNRSLGKVIFPCHRVDARWGKLECLDRACDLEGTTTTGYFSK